MVNRFGINGFFHCSMLVAALVLTVAMAVVFKAAALSVDPGQLIVRMLPVVAAVLYCRWRGFERMRQGVLIVGWAGLLSQLLQFPMYAAARLQFPLRDSVFAKLDGRLGLEVPMVLAWVRGHHGVEALLNLSYVAIFPMIILASTLPAMTGRWTAAKEFIVANIASNLIAMPIFPLVPAVGPWVFYHFIPSADQARCEQMIHILRQPGAFVIDLNYQAGLIAFPSFHVILAVLAASALCSVRALRPIAIALCVLVSVAAVGTGWHYVTDALGGLLCAALSIAVAKLYTRVELRVGERNSREAAALTPDRCRPATA